MKHVAWKSAHVIFAFWNNSSLMRKDAKILNDGFFNLDMYLIQFSLSPPL